MLVQSMVVTNTMSVKHALLAPVHGVWIMICASTMQQIVTTSSTTENTVLLVRTHWKNQFFFIWLVTTLKSLPTKWKRIGFFKCVDLYVAACSAFATCDSCTAQNAVNDTCSWCLDNNSCIPYSSRTSCEDAISWNKFCPNGSKKFRITQ